MAFRKLLGGKLHRITVTESNVHYEGSITLPPELVDAAGFREYEAVWVWNVTSGTRFLTYVMLGQPGSGEVCVNGAAAHLANPGDIVIVATFIYVDESEASQHKPKIVFVDAKNRVRELRSEQHGGL